jgi:hypothetical protein
MHSSELMRMHKNMRPEFEPLHAYPKTQPVERQKNHDANPAKVVM